MRRLAVLPALILAAATTATAQDTGAVELTPSIGYRVGGTLGDAVTGKTFDIEPSWSWGFVAGIAPGRPNLFIEMTYLQQFTRASDDNAFATGFHDLRIHTLLAGVQWDFSPKARVRPFVSAHVGATFIEAVLVGDTTPFTAALSGGVKLMATPRFGARFQVRALAMFAGGSTRGLCRYSDCEVGLTGWGILQTDLSVGALIAF